jgi:hypothetical protein
MNPILYPMCKKLFSRLLICSSIAISSMTYAQTTQGLIRLTRINTQVFVEDNVSKVREEKLGEEKITEQNTVVTTGSDSRVILVFSNGATINLGAESELNIQQFQQDPFADEYTIADATEEPNAKSLTRLHLTKGELVGNVKKLRSNLGSEFVVSTPAGAAGIRGTTFRIIYRPDGNGQAFFSVMTLEGEVEVSTTSGTTAAPISVGDQQEVEIMVEVDDTTGAVTLLTPITDLVATRAPPEVIAQATASFQQSAEAVVAIVLTAANDQVGGSGGGPAGDPTGRSGTTGSGDEGDAEEKPTTTPTDLKSPGTPGLGGG